MPKLYEIDQHRKIQIDEPDWEDKEEIYHFYHIDGMYSLCKDSKGNTIHFAAWTNVKDLGDYNGT